MNENYQVERQRVRLPSQRGIHEVEVRILVAVPSFNTLEVVEEIGPSEDGSFVDALEILRVRLADFVTMEENLLFGENFNFIRLRWNTIDVVSRLNTQANLSFTTTWNSITPSMDDRLELCLGLIGEFVEKCDEMFQHYDWVGVVGRISFETQMFSQDLIRDAEQHVQEARSSFLSGFKDFLIVNKATKTNCLWKHIWLADLFYSNHNKVKILTEEDEKLTRTSSRFKARVLTKFVDDVTGLDYCSFDMIPWIIKYFESQGRNYSIRIYSPQFVVEKTFNGEEKSKKVIKLRHVGQHVMLMFYRDELSKEDLMELELNGQFNENTTQKDFYGEKEVEYIKGVNQFILDGVPFTKNELEKKLFEEGNFTKVWDKIEPYRNFHSLDGLGKIGAFDFETYNGPHGVVPYLSGITYDSGEECDPISGETFGISRQFVGDEDDQNIYQFISFLEANLARFFNYTFYAHNGGKFDFFPLLRVILKQRNQVLKVDPDSILFVNGAIISMTWTAVHEGKVGCIHFRDSLRLLPASLKALGKSMGARVQKLDFDIGEITKENWKENIREIKRYHLNDIECLYYVMKNFQRKFYEITKKTSIIDDLPIEKGLDITKFVTISQASLCYFLTYGIQENPKLLRPPKAIDYLFRKFYFGGRCEMFYQGHVEEGTVQDYFKCNADNSYPLRLLYVDFNSLYPDQMTMKIPVGKPRFFKLNEGTQFYKTNQEGYHWITSDFHGFVHCKIKQTNYDLAKEFPQIVPYHNGERLYFCFFDKEYECLLDADELRQMENQPELGYQVTIVNFIQFEEKAFLKSFVEKFMILKEKAVREKDPAGKTIAKLVQNSLYGTFAINIFKDMIKIWSLDSNYYDRLDSWVKGNLLDINVVDDYIITKEKGELEPRCSNVIISTKITLLSRLKQQKFQYQCLKQGHMVVYGDTDSTIFGINPRMSTEEFLKSPIYDYIKGGQKGTLGLLKDEMFCLGKEVLSPNEFKEYLEEYELEESGEILPFNNFVCIAAKGYYCYSTINEKIQKGALKGCKMKDCEIDGEKVKVDQKIFQEAFIEKEILKVKQTVFQSGLPSVFSEVNPFKVVISKESKEFKPIYTKGNIQEPIKKGGIKRIYPKKFSEILTKDKQEKKYPIQEIINQFY